MRWISNVLFRIKATLFPGKMEEMMDDEMTFHLEMEAKKLISQGLDPDEARRAARRNFGEPMRQKEKAMFERGLRNAAKQTNAWILTGGTASGVMSMVGTMVQKAGSDAPICVGIAPFGCVMHHEEMDSSLRPQLVMEKALRDNLSRGVQALASGAPAAR